jgi:hypothetical protein
LTNYYKLVTALCATNQAKYIELMLNANNLAKNNNNELARFVLYLYIYILQYINNKSYIYIFFYKKNIDIDIYEYSSQNEGYSYV